MTANLVYLVFALGAAAVYFSLPRVGRSHVATGGILAVLALVAWGCVTAFHIAAGGDESAYFYLFAGIALAAGGRVVTHPKPVYCVLYFVVVVVAVAALLVLQGAEFLAVAVVLIYAGAIIVTYVFVIMLAQQRGSPTYDRRAREPFVAVLAGFLLMAAVAGRVVDGGGSVVASAEGARVPVLATGAAETTSVRVRPVSSRAPGAVAGVDDGTSGGGAGRLAAAPGNSEVLGVAVMTTYVVVLEVAGVLLLIAMIGAIAMSRKRVPSEGVSAPAVPLGQVGREVEPF